MSLAAGTILAHYRITAELGACSTSSNGSKIWIDYKAPAADRGDWNDRSSAHHY